MFDAYILLSRLNAELFALATRSVNDTWALLIPGALWLRSTSVPRHPDLITLGLDRMPRTGTELRRAYYHAAKAAHPDVGGSAYAFRAVVEAFERLAQNDIPAP
jgi:hypothetical protein